MLKNLNKMYIELYQTTKNYNDIDEMDLMHFMSLMEQMNDEKDNKMSAEDYFNRI